MNSLICYFAVIMFQTFLSIDLNMIQAREESSRCRTKLCILFPNVVNCRLSDNFTDSSCDKVEKCRVQDRTISDEVYPMIRIQSCNPHSP